MYYVSYRLFQGNGSKVPPIDRCLMNSDCLSMPFQVYPDTHTLFLLPLLFVRILHYPSLLLCVSNSNGPYTHPPNQSINAPNKKVLNSNVERPFFNQDYNLLPSGLLCSTPQNHAGVVRDIKVQAVNRSFGHCKLDRGLPQC